MAEAARDSKSEDPETRRAASGKAAAATRAYKNRNDLGPDFHPKRTSGGKGRSAG
ncbi:hypothetical protein [Marinitenerispora sediminis]|nr:hypothetical protein [Marinitenerispora sediminis]